MNNVIYQPLQFDYLPRGQKVRSKGKRAVQRKSGYCGILAQKVSVRQSVHTQALNRHASCVNGLV